jgi:prolyl oligopeptidase PreP (S9A serine peptidase family)
MAVGVQQGRQRLAGHHRVRPRHHEADPDVLKWAKFSGVAWYKDGFFYSRYPEPKKGTELSAASKFQKVYYHKLGDAQEKDVLVWENKVNGDLYVGVGSPKARSSPRCT